MTLLPIHTVRRLYDDHTLAVRANRSRQKLIGKCCLIGPTPSGRDTSTKVPKHRSKKAELAPGIEHRQHK